MSVDLADRLRIALPDASDQLASVPAPFIVLFERGDLSLELFAPQNIDTQQPHEQDELYIVAAGTGTFRRGTEIVPFAPGDVLFVATGRPHAFETFTDDFKTWVIFFGPRNGHERASP